MGIKFFLIGVGCVAAVLFLCANPALARSGANTNVQIESDKLDTSVDEKIDAKNPHIDLGGAASLAINDDGDPNLNMKF